MDTGPYRRLEPTEEDSWQKVDVKEEFVLTPSMHLATCYQTWSDSELNYMSGISKTCFQTLFLVLTKDALTMPSCNLSAQDQMLLTLCQYKHHFSYPLLSIIFKIQPNDAPAVFSFWTYHMFKTLKLYFGAALKAEPKVQHSVTVGVVKVPVLEPSSHCAHHCGYDETGEISSLKALVVIDDVNQSVLYCSKLYGKLTSNECILQDMEFQQCAAPSTLIKLHGSLNISNIFPDKNIQVILSDDVSQCICSKGGQSARCAFSSLMLTKCSQCLVEFYKILTDGIPSNLLIMSSEIFFNCMMLLNFPKASCGPL